MEWQYESSVFRLYSPEVEDSMRMRRYFAYSMCYQLDMNYRLCTEPTSEHRASSVMKGIKYSGEKYF